MNSDINILVAEDDVDINNLLNKILKKAGYNVTCAYSGSEALMCLKMRDYQLVILDLMLPGMPGEDIISEIRKSRTMPIIVISAKPGQDTRIQVLKLGADDFVPKPFDVNEVLARVQAQLRRYMIFSNKDKKKNIMTCKNMTLDKDKMEVKVKEEKISLTAMEFSILELLMEYPDKVFTKANIFEHVWNDEFMGDDNTVNVHVSNIRSKIAEKDPDEEYIHTVWGIGFKMSD